MIGLYSAIYKGGKKIIKYNGNEIFTPLMDVQKKAFDERITRNRMAHILSNQQYYFHLHKIDAGIFFGAVNYFRSIGAEWCNLPLTTLMISSPGEVYAGKTLDYTTDALPVDISWFDEKRNIFLSESSQFYLELRLLLENIDKVFSIYNSFRKEKADFTHLSEFQHIEFEGNVSFKKNIKIALDLVRAVTRYLIDNNRKSLIYFIGEEGVKNIETSFSQNNIVTVTFEEALEALYSETGNESYKEFSLKHFGAWEEIKLTEILKRHVIVTKFPLLQIPFYHNEVEKNENGVPLAENADFIFYGYRETIGSGTRISNPKALKEKATIFNLPSQDYDSYIKTRLQGNYRKTSGFGLGWQRYVQWALRLPFIWEATHVPRGHHLPKP